MVKDIILSPESAVLVPHCISRFPSLPSSNPFYFYSSQAPTLSLLCLASFLAFPLENFIPHYIISLPNENRQKGLWYLPTDYSKAQILIYFKSFTAAIHPSMLCYSDPPLFNSRLPLLVPHMGPQWPPLLCPSCSPPLTRTSSFFVCPVCPLLSLTRN